MCCYGHHSFEATHSKNRKYTAKISSLYFCNLLNNIYEVNDSACESLNLGK